MPNKNTSKENSLLITDYNFTSNWFSDVKHLWDLLIPKIKPCKILEVGTYEGASACYMIDELASEFDIELHCMDIWDGRTTDQQSDKSHMSYVEERFLANIKLAISNAIHKVDLFIHKGRSDIGLSKLLSGGRQNYFDFIYIDGSHQAPDVLYDAVVAFKLLKVGGYIVFDDYLWAEDFPYGNDPIRCPKPAIDAFINMNIRKLEILNFPLYQIYLKKISD